MNPANRLREARKQCAIVAEADVDETEAQAAKGLVVILNALATTVDQDDQTVATDGGRPECHACGQTHDTMAAAMDCCSEQLDSVSADHSSRLEWRDL